MARKNRGRVPEEVYAELRSAVSDLAQSAEGAVRQMTLRAELTATIAQTAKATQAANDLMAVARAAEMGELIQARLASRLPTGKSVPSQDNRARAPVDKLAVRPVADRVPPILELYDQFGGFIRR